ncbi:TBC-domain-containing protein [Aaosphaeria arxii CBS 175.79]|uniref:TBC-domain-containing protein n=1 Tax=Aaosphaeria arxii CBS 175.79 TaxID=1450172 RepID=A0A6A5Y1D3_9PLEO|nr:TBC-domain-containing protein [Aaosphaeria arxii CBS 175.79]KAF2019003.1 TBC-domain-containing protein [Aaosphaeria arxii CBS 175.79]
MAVVDAPNVGDLVRTSSQSSSRSVSRKSSTIRVKPSKRGSNTSLRRAPSPAADTKSLTSFPSLSPTPDTSPVHSRVNGWFRAAVGEGNPDDRDGENKAKSPETIKAILSPDLERPPPPTSHPAPNSTMRKVTKSTQQLVGSLVSATPSARERSALFDDTPQDIGKVPGNLHYLDDADIQNMLDQGDAVALVRQLAGDLAQRDVQITALRRRAEERERILRKMLQECEVSNMDIENRLRELEKSKDKSSGTASGTSRTKKRGDDYTVPGMHPEDPIDQRLALAIEDDASEVPASFGEERHPVTVGADDMSIASSSEPPRETGRSNWKSYLFSGTSKKSSRAPSVASMIDRDAGRASSQTRSRASSGAKPTRKPISNDLFVPPTSGADKAAGAVPTLRRLQSQDRDNSGSSSRRSSVSITNWALKMVAGNNQTNSMRGRKPNTSDPGDRTTSVDSTKTAQSAKSSLINTQKRNGRASLGPNGTIKSISTENSKAPAQGPPHLQGRGHSNLGPVEMDRILPEESRPPTLVQQHNMFNASQEYLTDRFGFIYDQRRKKRQSEAAAALSKNKRNSNVESLGDGRTVLDALGLEEAAAAPSSASNISDPSRPPSRPGSTSSGEQGNGQPSQTWQDYLKLATHPTELLSHTPSTAPIMETPEPDLIAPKVTQVTVAKRGSIPAISTNPEPSPSRIVSGNAEFSVTSPSPGHMTPISPHPYQADPVQALLEQLTELHDSLQRDKTTKWNEFLRKVRAERKREGEAVTSGDRPKGLTMPEALLHDGEIIGIAGLGNKGKLGRAKWQEFRRLVLSGIPVAYRAKIWTECSGASALRVPGYYDDIVNNGVDNPTIVAQIQMDITRTLTDNIFFRRGPGVHKLNEVLLAYSRRNPEVGYCQGMNLITACLLLIMPTAEDAFWVLASMIENILPQKYYDQHLLTSRADQSVLRSYVVEVLPKLSSHLDALEIELEALTFQWFLSVFTDCLSAEALFRVWDVVLCMHDGSTFLFQVALALLKLNEKALLQCDTPAEIYHYINHQMTNHAISIDGLIQASDALSKVVKRKDVEERRERAVALEEDLIRQREEARQERARKRASKSQEATESIQDADIAKSPSISASVDASMARETSPMRTPLSSASIRSEEDEAEALNQTLEELTNRTPMPIEEESLWRA